MSRGINKVILIGHVGSDPESNITGTTSVTKLSLATNAEWKDSNGNIKKETEWHRVCFFSKLSELVSRYVKKGSNLYIEGSLKTNRWKDKQTGEERQRVEIIAREVQFLDSKNEKNETFKATTDGNYSFDDFEL
jgi:single-strand DNA-binding protein